ncbi:MAG TPA: RNA polymerase sigma factor [Methylosinus sp.]|jgi:RNA polymerase sigma-70 factor (ECF subfamily)|uniref:RNA polymerase sigma factor n=1 Tax=Methylosinus sp. TaxID=427 RepID=UPI002F92204A
MSDSKFGVLAQAFFLRQPDLLKFLKRRVGAQDAPDLLQETYVRVRRYAASEAISNPEAFLFTTASNIAKNHRSRLETEQKYLNADGIPEDVPEARPLPDDQLDGRRRMRRLEVAIQGLPPRCREVFILLRIEELPAEEVARRLGISRNMVQKHLQLALQRCHDVLE